MSAIIVIKSETKLRRISWVNMSEPKAHQCPFQSTCLITYSDKIPSTGSHSRSRATQLSELSTEKEGRRWTKAFFELSSYYFDSETFPYQISETKLLCLKRVREESSAFFISGKLFLFTFRERLFARFSSTDKKCKNIHDHSVSFLLEFSETWLGLWNCFLFARLHFSFLQVTITDFLLRFRIVFPTFSRHDIFIFSKWLSQWTWAHQIEFKYQFP